MIGGGLAGGQGSQGTTRVPILLVKAIQMQCLPNTPPPRHSPQAAARLNEGAYTFVTATLINTAQSPPKLYINVAMAPYALYQDSHPKWMLLL